MAYAMAALLLIGALCFILGCIFGAIVSELGALSRRDPFDLRWKGGRNGDR